MDNVSGIAERYGTALTQGLTVADVQGLAADLARGHPRGGYGACRTVV